MRLLLMVKYSKLVIYALNAALLSARISSYGCEISVCFATNQAIKFLEYWLEWKYLFIYFIMYDEIEFVY